TDLDGRTHEMAGVVPLDTTMEGRRLSLGYRTLRALRDTPLAAAGDIVRGHEFHWSRASGTTDSPAYAVAERDGAPEGHARGNVLASYVHLHLASREGMADRFVARCAAVAR